MVSIPERGNSNAQAWGVTPQSVLREEQSGLSKTQPREEEREEKRGRVVADRLQDARKSSRRGKHAPHLLDRGGPWRAFEPESELCLSQLLFVGRAGLGQEVAGLISSLVPGN